MASILRNVCSILMMHLTVFAATPVTTASDQLTGLPPPSEGLVKYVPETRNAINNQPLYFSTFKAPYNTAVDYCRAANMKIVKIESTTKQQLVTSAMAREGARARWNRWMGLVYYAGDGNFYWSDGTLATWLYCESCTTNTASYGHAVLGDPEFPWLNRWINSDKTWNYGFICE